MGSWPNDEWTLQVRTAMMRFRGGGLLLALVFVACSDTAGPDVPGLPEPAQYTVRMVASAELPIDSAVVRMEGPTPRTFSMLEGGEVVVDGLAPGAYQVAVEGWRDESVAGFAEFAETFEAGDRQERPVTFEGVFAPEKVAATLDAGLIELEWDSVPGAMEYRIEVKATPDAAEFEFEGRTEATSLKIGPFEAGTHTVRVQAVDPFGNEGQPAAVPVTIEPNRFPVTVQVEEGVELAGGDLLAVGSVVSEPAGILCGDGNAQCQAEFPEGQEVVLKHVWPGVPQDVASAYGTAFGGWTGDCAGLESCVLTIDGPKEVVATAADELARFDLDPYILSSQGYDVPGWVTWRLTWEEAGSTCERYIDPSDGGSNTPPRGCHVWVAPGTRLTISSPVGPVDWLGWPDWGGGTVDWCESVEGNTCHAVVPPGVQSSVMSPVWDWSPPQGHSLLQIARPDFGLVRSDVGGIYKAPSSDTGYPLVCGEIVEDTFQLVCSQVYPDGTTVTLTAEPIEGYRVTGWTGVECSGTGPCEIVMSEWTRVKASFEPIAAPVLKPTDFCTDYPDEAIVTFEDAVLAAYVKEALGVTSDEDLTCAAVATLTTLEVMTIWVADLTGLQNLVGLQKLSLFGDSVKDIGPIRTLLNLTEVSIMTCGFTDISPLTGLTNLTSLTLYRCTGIPDFTALSTLTNLQRLDLSQSGIPNLSPLATLTRLEYLDLAEAAIRDLSPLAGLTSLSYLNFDMNYVLRDVQPLLDNPGIGPGDRIVLTGTLVTCEDVTLLEAKGVTVSSGCLRIITTSLPDGAVDVAYSAALEAAGFWVEPWTEGNWSVVDGGLPTGLSLDDAGEIWGTPTEAGTYDFTVEYATMVGGEVISARQPLSITIGSSLGTGFALDQYGRIPAGTFQMGDITGSGQSDERPVHTVNLTRDFYIQRTEVTQAQWREIMGDNPSNRSGCDLCPVDQVSWDDVQVFLARLNAAYPDAGFRLPTEAEWEYAARAGTTGDFGGTGVLDEMGWYSENAGQRTHPVGLKLPNDWGLYDMHGNVKEWVEDRYSQTYYSESPTDDPAGPSSPCDVGTEGAASKTGCVDYWGRVLRGGSLRSVATNARSAKRGNSGADWAGGDFGFRLVRTR
ncbi:MAG: SUMF1/EgtB/PvdO family nonheme iron enzyme [Gemmatimonadota bacterium]